MGVDRASAMTLMVGVVGTAAAVPRMPLDLCREAARAAECTGQHNCLQGERAVAYPYQLADLSRPSSFEPRCMISPILSIFSASLSLGSRMICWFALNISRLAIATS